MKTYETAMEWSKGNFHLYDSYYIGHSRYVLCLHLAGMEFLFFSASREEASRRQVLNILAGRGGASRRSHRYQVPLNTGVNYLDKQYETVICYSFCSKSSMSADNNGYT